MKCKNCYFEDYNQNKPKPNNRIKKIELLMSLYTHFELNHYNGKLEIKDIWYDLNNKLKNYKSEDDNNNITFHKILSSLEKVPDNTSIKLLKLFK